MHHLVVVSVVPAHTMLAHVESHTDNSGGSSFTTQLFAAPGVHDGPFVDQYRSTNASF
jgi:hypothetical protein